MGEAGEHFAAIREQSKAKRASNREKGAERLALEGIEYASKNNGAHLIVAGEWDYWPGTGAFRHRLTPTQGRGINNLIREIRR